MNQKLIDFEAMAVMLRLMSLLDKINADLKQAMREKDEITRETLRMVKAAFDMEAEPDELAILTRAVKSRKESAQSYREGGRDDLAEKEEAEIEVVQRYLPKALSEEEAREAIAAIAQELGVESKKDMGRLMKAIMERHRGQIDGKLASSITATLLK